MQAFFDRVTEAMLPGSPCEVWAGVTLDPLTLISTGGNYRRGVPIELLPRMLDIEYREGDVNHIPDLARRRAPVGLLSREVTGDPRNSPRYRDICQPLGQRDELRVVLRDRHGTWGALVLGRSADLPPFDEAELEAAASLAEPLAQVLRRLLVEESARSASHPAAPGLVMLDADYAPVFTSPTADHWLGELESGDGSHGLPVAVYAVAASVRAAARAGEASRSVTSWARARSREAVQLHAWSLDENLGACVAVAMEPADPHGRAAFLVRAYGLSPRECAVTELVFHGYSTQEISRRLRLSPHTVQDHLKSVFDKTGVRSRRDLVAAIFSRHYAPTASPLPT
ncbi:helix-turn-helix transcriptional regulator [Streptomyces sp. NPDC003522]